MTRPSTTDRGYDSAHRRLRGLWTHRIKQGGVTCWRCGKPIEADSDWHLGHDDEDRTKYRGPEHGRECNLSAAGKKAARQWAERSRRPKQQHPGLLP